jgi:hypothetical protein
MCYCFWLLFRLIFEIVSSLIRSFIRVLASSNVKCSPVLPYEQVDIIVTYQHNAGCHGLRDVTVDRYPSVTALSTHGAHCWAKADIPLGLSNYAAMAAMFYILDTICWILITRYVLVLRLVLWIYNGAPCSMSYDKSPNRAGWWWGAV